MNKEIDEKRKKIFESLERGDKISIAKTMKCTYPTVRSAFKKDLDDINEFDLKVFSVAQRIIDNRVRRRKRMAELLINK